jgi:hypothetical protein
MIKRALMLGAAVFVVACNSGPPPGSAQNTVGGADIVASSRAPMTKNEWTLSLHLGEKAQAGQTAIADVLTYRGSKLGITAPAGWQLIRDDSTATTRQSLYWHAIQPNDPSTATWTFSEPADAQGAIVLLANAATDAPVDMTSGNTGTGGDVKSAQMTTTANGDLILIFKSTDFGNAPLVGQVPGDMSAVVKQETLPNEYWIVGTYQGQSGSTEETLFNFPQLFNWVAAQVGIKHASH